MHCKVFQVNEENIILLKNANVKKSSKNDVTGNCR